MTELRANTIYVGQHFEVRDHDQPTKYVFNGSTRVARITGSLSANTRIQRFRVRTGWNLLSLAVSVPDLSDQLQRPDAITSARAWNPQTSNYSTVPQVAPAGTVLWVHATTNATIAVVGTYADPANRQVSAGATYLPSTGLEAWTPSFPLTMAAWSFNSQLSSLIPHPTWLARLTGDLSSVNELPLSFDPGQALFVVNPAPAELVAPDPALRIRYYHQDHLGSSSVMTDANGTLVEETAFYPFGIPRREHRLRHVEEAYKFTQKERDRESGLHYFEARYLASGLARFMSPDPMYANPGALSGADAAAFLATPQKINIYAYARNNPLNYIDPTGLQDDWAAGTEDESWSNDPDDVAEADWEGGGGAADTIANMGRQGVSFVVGASDALAWGMGASYQVLRPVVIEGYNVDTDSAGYTGGKWFGNAVNVAASLFIPGPKGPPAAPGTVTLFAKTPAPIAAVATGGTSAGSMGGPVRFDPNTNIRIGQSDTVPFVRADTLYFWRQPAKSSHRQRHPFGQPSHRSSYATDRRDRRYSGRTTAGTSDRDPPIDISRALVGSGRPRITRFES